MISYLPKYFTTKSTVLYVFIIIVVSFSFFNRSLPAIFILTGLIATFTFFNYSNILTQKWAEHSSQIYRKKLFKTALIIRLFYVVFSYLFYSFTTGEPFEFDSGDSQGYHDEGTWVSYLISNNRLKEFFLARGDNYSDMGYSYYLGSLYFIIGNKILATRLLKAVISSYTCILVFNLAKRNFGDQTGKIAGILAMLSPNLVYYCGLHLKETEMVFLLVAFIERGDFLLRTRNIKPVTLLLTLLLGLSLFFFRTVLGIAASFALATSVIFSPTVLIKLNRKLVFFFWGGLLLLFTLGGTLEKNVTKYLDDSSENQTKGMKSRANRVGGNKLAKHGSTAMFAPVILIAPFPTLVNIDAQQNQMMLNGGYFTKNIIGFFVLLALFVLYKKREIRNHTLLLSFVISYLAIIAMSTFALSERFHLPALPFLLILAAYGITQVTNQSKKYFLFYLVIVSVLIIGWNWFKVTGRA